MLLKSLKFILSTIFFFLSLNLSFSSDLIIPKIKPSQQKADLLYDEIDRNPLFYGTANKEDRSNMNVCFLLNENSKKDTFDKLCNEVKINGIKGHRSVGGYRASIYNAMPIESVQVLVNLMQKLERI